MSLRLLAALLVVMFLVSPAAPHARSSEGGTNSTLSSEFKVFRCRRPFSAMSSFRKIGDSGAHKNCDFDYFQIENASARVQCKAQKPKQSSGESAEELLLCNVEANIAVRLAKDASERFERSVGSMKQHADITHSPSSVQAMLLDSDDPWRYSLELRSTLERGTAIHYKGYNGQGYSLCCSAIQEAKCKWIYEEAGALSLGTNESLGEAKKEAVTAQLVLADCPLPLPASGGRNHSNLCPTDSPPGGGVFHLNVSRPLHRFVPGSWEVRFELWRQRTSFVAKTKGTNGTPSMADPEVLGRIIVPFELPRGVEDEGKDAETQPLLPVIVPTGAGCEEEDMTGDL